MDRHRQAFNKGNRAVLTKQLGRLKCTNVNAALQWSSITNFA